VGFEPHESGRTLKGFSPGDFSDFFEPFVGSLFAGQEE
jgi:hypothetical protein